MSENKSLEGLGGWLILVGIGIIISPIRILIQVLPIYNDIFKNGAWAFLTTPGSDAYSPFWAPLIIGEITINGLLILTWLIIAVLFFTKHRLFPKVYIGVLLFTLAFIFVDALAVKGVAPETEAFDPETVKELARTLVTVSIWVPYMLLSKRVKATFTRQRQIQQV